MSVLTNGVYLKDAADRIYFGGVTLDNSGKVSAATGPTLSYSATDPEGSIVAPAGSLLIGPTGLWMKLSGSGNTGWSLELVNPVGGPAISDDVVVNGIIRHSHAGGAATAVIALPSRATGFNVVDAHVRSEGGTGGTVTVNNQASAAVSDAMVPGNTGVITRAGSIDAGNGDGVTGLELVFAAGSPACTVFVRVENA
jgi:hypothetical protein